MKDRRAIGLNSSGPHSQVLQQEAGVTQYFDGIGQQQQRAVRIGTASKGIIDREYQHNADGGWTRQHLNMNK
jgi:hypothetical protein